jgi:ferritin
MKLSDAMVEALNSQMHAEFGAYYNYLAMSVWFSARYLHGFASWMRAQSEEERSHAIRLLSHIEDRDGTPELRTLDAPKISWTTPLEAVETALANEQKVTQQIYGIADLAESERDHATRTFMQWYVNEQVEEEATARDLVGQLRLLGDSREGLFLMDRELAGRQAPAETASAE